MNQEKSSIASNIDSIPVKKKMSSLRFLFNIESLVRMVKKQIAVAAKSISISSSLSILKTTTHKF
jgi:hypothetical protein